MRSQIDIKVATRARPSQRAACVQICVIATLLTVCVGGSQKTRRGGGSKHCFPPRFRATGVISLFGDYRGTPSPSALTLSPEGAGVQGAVPATGRRSSHGLGNQTPH